MKKSVYRNLPIEINGKILLSGIYQQLDAGITMNTVLLQSRISQKEVEQLLAEFSQFLFLPAGEVQYKSLKPEQWAEMEIIFGNRLTAHELDMAPKLRWIHSPNPNLSRLCLDEIQKRGNVILTITPEENSAQVGEFFIGSLLAFAKNLYHWRDVNRFPSHVWDSKWRDSLWSLQGKTMAQIGLNLAGLEMARLARLLQMKVVGVDKKSTFHPWCHENIALGDLSGVLPSFDVVSLCLPKGKEWDNWLDEEKLERMKEDSILAIAGSHKVIDEKALAKVAQTGKFRGIILDAFHPTPIPPSSLLWNIPNILITPDIGPRPKSQKSHAYSIFRFNLRQYLHGNFGDMKHRGEG